MPDPKSIPIASESVQTQNPAKTDTNKREKIDCSSFATQMSTFLCSKVSQKERIPTKANKSKILHACQTSRGSSILKFWQIFGKKKKKRKKSLLQELDFLDDPLQKRQKTISNHTGGLSLKGLLPHFLMY